LFTSIPRSSLEATAKVPANCFVSLRLIPRIRRSEPTEPSITPRISSRARLS
jgi:hypothetical protein